jgi:pimeloyl-ACP methyl ester carboxylesterase
MGLQALVPFKLKGWRHLPDEAQRLAVHRENLQLLMLHAPEAITPLACQLQLANTLRDKLPKRRLSRTDILARAMPGLRCPLHAVYGEHDPFYKGQTQAFENVLQQAPGFRGMHAIAAAGHWVQFEQADAFNQRLLALLETPHGPVQGG